MLGLLHKDFMISKKEFAQIAAIFTLSYLACWLFPGSLYFLTPPFLRTVAMTLTLIFSLGLFSKDNTSKWNVFLLSLPATKPMLAGARYLFLVLTALCAGGVSFAAIRLLGLMNWQVAISAHILSLVISFVLISIVVPTAYLFGSEDARILMVMIFLGLGVALLVIDNPLFQLFSLDNPNTFTMHFAALALSVILLFLSYLLSCRILRKTDSK